MSVGLTEDEFKSVLPANFKKSVNQQLIDSINKKITDPEEMEHFRDNLVGYASILKDGKFQLEKFVDAVRYVGFKMAGLTNIDAYRRTFPDKIQRFVMDGVADKDIASYCTAYTKSKLVTLIMEQAFIPIWLANQDNYQRAINVQVELMLGSQSDKVRCDAANSLMTHLKPPEVRKVELDITTKEDSVITALRDSTAALIAAQRTAIQSGMQDAQQVAHTRLFTTQYKDITDAETV
jgi:hypothetical protein